MDSFLISLGSFTLYIYKKKKKASRKKAEPAASKIRAREDKPLHASLESCLVYFAYQREHFSLQIKEHYSRNPR